MIMRQPLSIDDLRTIQDRNSDSPDVRALLWEVRRLRATVLRSHDYVRLDPGSSTAKMVVDGLRRTLDVEPVVLEQPKLP